MRHTKAWKPLALALLLAGCAAGPDYTAPELSVPAGWRQADTESSAPLAAGQLDRWWRSFDDPVLDQLIEAALENNTDLRIAVSRIDEARAQLRAARAEFFPSINGNAGASRSRSSEYVQGPPGGQGIASNFRLNLDLSYEVDLWGRLRRADEAATARLLSSEANRDAVRQRLIADVTRAYLDLRTLDAQLEIAHQTLASREEELRLQKRRFDGGVISALELNQAEVEYNDARMAVPDLKMRVAMAENALSTLLAEPPTAIARGKPLAEIGRPATIPAGLPSELMQRRPDVRAAEQELIAANADIGQARAAYYPRLSLTGLLGMESGDLSDLLKSGARTWSAGANVMAPLLPPGKAASAEAIARARQEQALVRYRQVVFEAFREVEDALVAQRLTREIVAEQEAQEKALSKSLALAQKRYRSGLSGYLEVLLTERSLFQTRLRLLDGRRSQANASIALYRALGGDWQTPPPATP